MCFTVTPVFWSFCRHSFHSCTQLCTILLVTSCCVCECASSFCFAFLLISDLQNHHFSISEHISCPPWLGACHPQSVSGSSQICSLWSGAHALLTPEIIVSADWGFSIIVAAMPSTSFRPVILSCCQFVIAHTSLHVIDLLLTCCVDGSSASNLVSISVQRHTESLDRSPTFGSLNVRSLLPSKLDSLLIEMHDRSMDVMLSCETWYDVDTVLIRHLRADGLGVIERACLCSCCAEACLSVSHGGVAIIAAAGVCMKAVDIGTQPSTVECVAARFFFGVSTCLVIVSTAPARWPPTSSSSFRIFSITCRRLATLSYCLGTSIHRNHRRLGVLQTRPAHDWCYSRCR